MHALDAAPILVSVDFSLCSDKVVQEAAVLGRELGTSLVVLHVVDTPVGLPADAQVLQSGDGTPVPVGELLTTEASREMPRYVHRAESLGVKTTTVTRQGDVVDTILAEAERVGARMLVMGTHGRTGLTRLVVGSVAESVLRRATVPVLTIRTLHEHACEATSCARCTSGQMPSAELLAAETMG